MQKLQDHLGCWTLIWLSVPSYLYQSFIVQSVCTQSLTFDHTSKCQRRKKGTAALISNFLIILINTFFLLFHQSVKHFSQCFTFIYLFHNFLPLQDAFAYNTNKLTVKVEQAFAYDI